jgi:amino acid adenylation domain-containing protein
MNVTTTASTASEAVDQSIRAGRIYPPVTSTDCSIGQIISRYAAKNPAALAITSPGATLTYEDLDQRANQLANYLIAHEIRRETIVAICLDRSAESIISALAVLKAGGAYLPLDPKLPIERLNFMLRDAQPSVLIGRHDIAEGTNCGSWKIIDVDRDREIEKYSVASPRVEVTREQLAYVIYTSGSTGEPKGVEITVANLLNLIAWHVAEFQINEADRASHLAGVAFDASVWEIWPYLTAGASLHLPDDDTRLSIEALRDWLIANDINVSFLPTALAEPMMMLEWPRRTALRFLLTGADVLHRRPASDLPFEVVNNYGPTECTVVATSGRVPGNNNPALPAIGYPIANSEIYILDEFLRPVAQGETGEIFIGGANVGRGYLNRPDLTAARFIADPFSRETGARLYRTGDLARRLPGGEIAYAGRADDQIKILGYRIEPAEIEAVINRHQFVRSSVVVAREQDCPSKQLVAYITTRTNGQLSRTELCQFVQSSLPDYMVPALFVKLDELPLTANGKIDRAALPEPSGENILRDAHLARPQSPVEERLAEILCSLFKVKEVGVNDNFFLLGGHSLLGAQLIVKIRNAFGIDIALRTLFDAPTIAALSIEIERLIVARVAAMSEAEAQALLA